jgi:SAM-dependent methyltransferase
MNNNSIEQYFDTFEKYDEYYQGPWRYYRKRYERKIELAFAQQPLRVLDLGCGRWGSLPGLVNSARILEYQCVDSSQESLKSLASEYATNKNIRITNEDVYEYLVHCQQKYDVILVFGVIMYLADDLVSDFCARLAERLAPNGLLLIHEPNEQASLHLDRYSKAMDRARYAKLSEIFGDKYRISKRNYNIILLRKPLFYLTRFLTLKAGRTLLDILWYFESVIESLLSLTKAGCDSMLVIRKL